MKTTTKKPRGYQYTIHKADCACMPCRCKRGEIKSTKTAISLRIESTMKEDLMKVSLKEETSLSTTIEAIIRHWMNGNIDVLRDTSLQYFPERQKR